MGTQSTWELPTHKMVFSLPSKAAIEKDLPSKATLEADAGKVYLLAQHVQGLTHTSTPAECQTSLTAITDKLRGHLGVGALVSRGLETYGKDPVTYGVKKYLTVEGCTFQVGRPDHTEACAVSFHCCMPLAWTMYVAQLGHQSLVGQRDVQNFWSGVDWWNLLHSLQCLGHAAFVTTCCTHGLHQ